jgi:FkbM family methyltransferase
MKTDGIEPSAGRTIEAPGRHPDAAALGAKCRTIKLPCGVAFSVFLDVEAEDDLSRALLVGDCPEQTAIELMLSLVRPGDVVLDLGAHVGTFTLAAAAAGCEVIAVEASPRNVAFLKAGVAANGFDRVRIVSAVVAEESGTVEFCPRGAVGHVPTPLTNFERIEVPAVCVDELLCRYGLERVSFIKMDVEGSEIRALRGMSHLFSRPDAPPVLYESNGHTLWFYGERPSRLKAEMEAAGYRNYLVGPTSLTPVTSADPQLECRVDYLAVKGPVPDCVHLPIGPRSSRSEVVEQIVAGYDNRDEPSQAHLLRELQDAPDWVRRHPLVKEVLRRLRLHGESPPPRDELEEIIEIRDPEIDLHDLLQRIRRNLGYREELPPVVRPPDHLMMQHQGLAHALGAVRRAVESYGTIESERSGLIAKAKRFLKRCIRKAIRRHVDQQIDVHWKLFALLEQMLEHQRQLLAYFGDTVRCVDRNEQFAVDWLDRLADQLDALEASVHDCRQDAVPLGPFDDRASSPSRNDGPALAR